jgi:hypothetical protein
VDTLQTKPGAQSVVVAQSGLQLPVAALQVNVSQGLCAPSGPIDSLRSGEHFAPPFGVHFFSVLQPYPVAQSASDEQSVRQFPVAESHVYALQGVGVAATQAPAPLQVLLVELPESHFAPHVVVAGG